MNGQKTVRAKEESYQLVNDSRELTNMLLRFRNLVNDSVKATGRKFDVFTDGRKGLAFVLKDLSSPTLRASIAELFRGEGLQYLLRKADQYGFLYLRGEEEPGFIDMGTGHTFQFIIPGIDIRLEQDVNFLQDVGRETA